MLEGLQDCATKKLAVDIFSFKYRDRNIEIYLYLYCFFVSRIAFLRLVTQEDNEKYSRLVKAVVCNDFVMATKVRVNYDRCMIFAWVFGIYFILI